jgi:hypothetical protein
VRLLGNGGAEVQSRRRARLLFYRAGRTMRTATMGCALRPEPDSIAKYLRRVAPSEGRAFQGRSMFPLEGRIRCWRRRGVATGQARATIMMAGRTDSEKPELFVLVREVRGYSGVAPIETRARSYADGVAAQVRSIIDPIRNLHRT